MGKPLIAIIDPNTLAAMGLRQLLQNVMPIITVDCYGTMTELSANHPEKYVHYFASISVILENRSFFLENRRKTIALTLSTDSNLQPTEFHSICVNVPEKQLVRSILSMVQHAHGQGQHLPPMPKPPQQKGLSDREIEVMSLIVQGYINKEIADKLNIGLATVITHRRNIMEKLGIKSVSALTVYAVTHGYVDINKISSM